MEIENINDINIYKLRMNATVIDKLFWPKHIFEPISQLVDVGCADGTLLNTFKIVSPNTELIGIDNNSDMLNSVKGDIKTFSSLAELDKLKKGSVLNLSSVLHEVYSYCDKAEIKEFWSNILRLEPEYITIRDMYCAEVFDYKDEIPKLKEIIKKSEHAQQLEAFEEYWGEIENIRTMMHFLLKYNYKENWARELKENYLPWDMEELINNIKGKYKLMYYSKGQLPYLEHKIKEDFGVKFLHDSHIKLILKKM